MLEDDKLALFAVVVQDWRAGVERGRGARLVVGEEDERRGFGGCMQGFHGFSSGFGLGLLLCCAVWEVFDGGEVGRGWEKFGVGENWLRWGEMPTA